MRIPLIRKRLGQVALWALLPVVIGTFLRVSRLGDYDNSYYTATVASMLGSAHNFLFASFDPAGIVMVDKPPVALWLQAASSAIFGVSSWSVTLPQILMGIASIAVLYRLISYVYGRLSGAIAANERPAYFLVPNDRMFGPGRGRQQDPIIAEVIGTWEDYSARAGLPPKTLFKNPDN